MGSNLFRIFFRLAIIFTIIVFAMQPYNWFCGITNKCSPIEFSSLIPSREGEKPVDVFFEITNYRVDLKLEPVEDHISTVSGRKNVVIYRAKNLTNKTITFRAEFLIRPEFLKGHVKTFDCLCLGEHKLKGGEEAELKMSFAIDEKAVDVALENQAGPGGKNKDQIVLRYKVK